MIVLDRLYGGKKNALTLSFDDGSINDVRMIEIMNKYGIRGTFHLISNALDGELTVKSSEISKLYDNHEVACHGVYHTSLTLLNSQNIINEIYYNKMELESYCGYPIRGMSYANGRYDDHVMSSIKACGMEYSRTVNNTGNFKFPTNFLEWNPTCRFTNALEFGEKLLSEINGYFAGPRLLYVWGHSHEMHTEEDWIKFEEFCKLMSNNDDIWYATNVELLEYDKAAKNLIISADNKMIYNPSAIAVWFTNSDDGETYCVDPGKTFIL